MLVALAEGQKGQSFSQRDILTKQRLLHWDEEYVAELLGVALDILTESTLWSSNTLAYALTGTDASQMLCQVSWIPDHYMKRW